VRDHIGVRPLTYSIKDDLLIFASHEFGIAKSNLVNNSLSETTLIRTFYLRKKQEYSSTVFQRIKKIIPGYVSTVTSSKVSEIKYWIPGKIKTNKHLTFEMAVSYLREHLIKSVQVRMEQGKIGTHVSGGIDSSGVGAILADYIDDKKRLKGYSWSPQTIVQEVDGLNEKELVDEFSKQKGIEIDYLTYSNQADIDDFILPEFEQMPIEIYTMLQASKDEINTMFSGWGGDEFVSLSLRGSMNHIILRLKLLTLYRWIKFWGIKATVARAKGEILPLLDPLGMFDSNAISRLRLNLFQFVFIMKHWRLFFFQREKLIYGFGDRNGFVLRLLYRYHLPQRMDSWALFGEKFGLDYKFPLLDKHLLEYWFTIPIKFTYEGMCHRFLYREAMKNILTDSIRKRTDKDESVLIQNNSERRLLLRKKIAELPELFVNSPLLKFFKADEFYKCATKKAPERTACIVGMYDIRFFLRYKSLVEKYLIHNQIFMNSRKEE
jgi:asparagine synthase (glutamine-hydrolysing)